MSIIGENIKKLRDERAVTQEQLAEKLCISYQAVSKWETGVSHSLRYGIRYDNTTLICCLL